MNEKGTNQMNTAPDIATQLKLIRAAAQETNLDYACRIIQDGIGQDDGGVAGMFFSGPEGDSYPNATYSERVEILTEYMAAEMAYIS